MHFGQRGTITMSMTRNFKEMKVSCNNIFMSIFIAKTITDSWGMFVLV